MEQNVIESDSLEEKLLYVYKQLEEEKKLKEGIFFKEKVLRAFLPISSDLRSLNEIFKNTEKINGNNFNSLFLILKDIYNSINDILKQIDCKKVNSIYKYRICKELKKQANMMLEEVITYEKKVIIDNLNRKKLDEDLKIHLENLFKKFTEEFNIFLVSYEKSVENNIDTRVKNIVTYIGNSKQTFDEKEFILKDIFNIEEFNRRSNDIVNRFIKELLLFHNEGITINNFINSNNINNNDIEDNRSIFEKLNNNEPIGINIDCISKNIKFKNLEFLNQIGLFNSINAFLKMDKIKDGIRYILKEIIEEANEKYEQLSIDCYKKIYNDIFKIREDSFKQLYGPSENIDKQLSILGNIKNSLLEVEYRKICSNSIIEYLTGAII